MPNTDLRSCWDDIPRSNKSANLGDAVAILADYDQAVETIEQEDVGFDDRPYFCHGGSPQRSSGASDDGAVFDVESLKSSPTTSHHSETEISELPDDSRQNSQAPERRPSAYTPLKQSSPFRNPSSVRAMHFDTTPPFRHSSYLNSPRPRPDQYSSPSRVGTPRSQSAMKYRQSPKKKKEHALVLLHATILPVPLPYSAESMKAVLPSRIMENYKLLQDKISETVLVRGILIAHPREDYELLEERLLESLELKLPRILKCGHFHLDDDADVHSGAEDEDGYTSDDEDLDICEDCGRRIRDGKHGSGSGTRRWDIKVYASNGLMRGGAWEAAWREMEKIDVEIGPWLPEEMKKELNVIREREVLQQQREQKAALEAELSASRDQGRGIPRESPRSNQRHWTRPQRTGHDTELDETARLAELYGENYIPSRDKRRPDTLRRSRRNISQARSYQEPRVEIPLSTLIKNYFYVVAQDRKNIAIAVLVLIIALLSSSAWFTRSGPSLGEENSSATPFLMRNSEAEPPSLYGTSSNPVRSSQSVQARAAHFVSHSPEASRGKTKVGPTSSSQTSSSHSSIQPSASDTPDSASAAEQEMPPDLADSGAIADTEGADHGEDEAVPQKKEAYTGIFDLGDESAHLVEAMED